LAVDLAGETRRPTPLYRYHVSPQHKVGESLTSTT
jgi:hypothetical protein